MAEEPPRKIRRVACVECRQSKIKCIQGQVPCPRCKRLGLDCKYEESFRRINRTSKIEQLEDDVQKLHRFMGTRQEPLPPLAHHLNTAPPALLNGQTGSPAPVGASNYILSPPREYRQSLHEQSLSLTHLQNLAESHLPFCLGNITLEVSLAEILFKTFFDKYHHFLPFLNPRQVAREYYKRSNILFWTIIAIASRQHQTDGPLSKNIYPLLYELIWPAIASPPIHLATIQAIILVCNWPITSVRITTDVSSILIAIACTAAKQLGLHRPGHEQGFDVTGIAQMEKDCSERLCTWVACAVTAQCLAGDHGLETPTSLQDFTFDAICEGNISVAVPDELRHHLMIRRFCNKISNYLSHNNRDPLGLPTEADRLESLSRLEDELGTLSASLRGQLSFANTMRLLDAEICLRSTWFLPYSARESARAGVLKAYSSATSLISYTVTCEMSNSMLPFAPLSFFRIYFAAALLIWKVLNSDASGGLDRNHGKTLYDAAAFAMRNISVDKEDVPIRASRGLNLLWRLTEKDLEMRNRPPTVTVMGRLTANMHYDCLLRLRALKGTWKPRDLHEHSETSGGTSELELGQSRDVTSKDTSSGVHQEAGTTSLRLMEPLVANQNGVADLQAWDDLPDIDWPWSSDFPAFYDF